MRACDIEQQLRTAGLSLHVYDTLPSTNTLAKELGEAGAAEGTVVIASHQTAGKGTRGRSFYSPDATGLYMSVLLRPTMHAKDALLITTAAAVAVCRAVERLSAKQPLIKWVNDVYCDGKKVCGILTESSLKTGSAMLDYAVLGVGVNVSPPTSGFPKDIEQIAGTVFDTPTDVSPLAALILDEFFSLYTALGERRFVREYRERSCLLGREITVCNGGDTAKTVALDIDDDCRLVVRYENGEVVSLSSGDVSVRL